MARIKLIADAGSTKVEWCLVEGKKKKIVRTSGISPYFLSKEDIQLLIKKELASRVDLNNVDEVHYYGTGCANKANALSVKKAIQFHSPSASIEVTHDLMGAARGLCGHNKGIACILGTGSNSCYYNGKKIVRNSPGLGYVLGDEGSGSYLGKKVLQHYLYGIFDEELRGRFDLSFMTNPSEILDNVYKKQLPNRYLASFTLFLAENRGHYMIENIIEDGLNDFFFQHLCRYPEVWKQPVFFTGGVAHVFRDVVKQLCKQYEFELGAILQNPMEGLLNYHR